MLAHVQDRSHSLAAKPAKMPPAKRPRPPAGHAIYAESGQIGLAGSDHKARRARIRRLAKSPARERRRQFVKVLLANFRSAAAATPLWTSLQISKVESDPKRHRR